MANTTFTGRATEARARVKSQGEMLVQKLTAFLQTDRRGERYLVATSSARLAAPIIIETGDPVMARGGFHGLDPILTPEQLVETRQVRYGMLGELSPTSRRLGGEAAGQPIADWIRAHGQSVDPSLWRPDVPAGHRPAARMDTMQLYDLRPDSTPTKQ